MCVYYGICIYIYTYDLLLGIKRWEFKWLRKILKLRRRPDEGTQQYNIRTSRRITAWSRLTGCKLMHHRVLLSIFRNAWREASFCYPSGQKHLLQARCCRNRRWWEGVKHETVWLRGHFDCKRWTKGNYIEWEDVLVLVFGLDWREFRARMVAPLTKQDYGS